MEYKQLKESIPLIKKALQHYKFSVAILVILGFLSSLFEVIGISALIPLFSFASNQGVGNDIITSSINKFFIFFNIKFNLVYLLIFISILFILKAMATILLNYTQVKITADYEEKLRKNLYYKTIRGNWNYLLKQKIGHLETILKHDIGNSLALLNQSSKALITLISLTIYITVAINISLTITLVTTIIACILFLFLKKYIYKIKTLSYKGEALGKKLTYHTNESTLGAKTIKVMGVEDAVSTISNKLFYDLKKYSLQIFKLKIFTNEIIQPVSVIFICAIFFISFQFGNLNIGALAAVIYLINRIFQYFQTLQSSLHDITGTIPYVQRIYNYNNEITKNIEKHTGNKKFEFDKKIEFNNISFAYNDKQVILSNLNFKIKKGEMIGLIGASGSGKTTIADLTLNLLKPTAGEITLDGININEIDIKQWRKNVGYVSQDIFLQDDTVENNIKFYDDSITKEGVIKAAKLANIHETIMKLKNGYETEIGERGLTLSGGQRQRIVIARILAKNPKILVLDEATSALDNESETKIQNVIENLKGKITVLVIAHRISTIMNSDKLIVLEKGSIIEEGAPNDLIKNKKSYLYRISNIRKQ